MKRAYPYLKILWRCIYMPLEWLILFLLVFWSIALLLSRIGVAAEDVPAAAKTHTVYITSNGVHSDVVLPLRDTQVNWIKELNLPDSLLQDSLRTHFAFGWGDKGFFLETKNWSDLKASVALRAAFHLGHSAMHIVQVAEPDTNDRETIRLQLTQEQYERLIAFIGNGFRKTKKTYEPILQHPYGRYHYFFEAKRSYGLTYTCNSWTNSALKAAGQKACVWTAFKDGIYLQYGRN